MPKYMATVAWRGALNIGNMRIFDTKDEAFYYVEGLDDPHPRVYKLSSNAPPKLLRSRESKE